MRKFYPVLLFLLLITGAAAAQPGDPNGGGKPGAVPITGVEWLLLGGGLIGARSIYKKYRSRN